MTRTGFFSDERTFWHSTGVQALLMPIGGWVQPPTGSYGADTPDSKRRLLNLVNASGLGQRMDFQASDPVTQAEIPPVHPGDCLHRCKESCDAGGGDLGQPPRAWFARFRCRKQDRAPWMISRRT